MFGRRDASLDIDRERQHLPSLRVCHVFGGANNCGGHVNLIYNDQRTSLHLVCVNDAEGNTFELIGALKLPDVFAKPFCKVVVDLAHLVRRLSLLRTRQDHGLNLQQGVINLIVS